MESTNKQTSNMIHKEIMFLGQFERKCVHHTHTQTYEIIYEADNTVCFHTLTNTVCMDCNLVLKTTRKNVKHEKIGIITAGELVVTCDKCKKKLVALS